MTKKQVKKQAEVQRLFPSAVVRLEKRVGEDLIHIYPKRGTERETFFKAKDFANSVGLEVSLHMDYLTLF